MMKKPIFLTLLIIILTVSNLMSVQAIDLKQIKEAMGNQNIGVQKSSVSTNEITCKSDKCNSLSSLIEKKQKELDLDYEKMNDLLDSITDEKVKILRQKVEKYTDRVSQQGNTRYNDYTTDLKNYYFELINTASKINPDIGSFDMQILKKENDLDKTKRELYSEYSKEFINQRRKEQNLPEIGKEKSVKQETTKTTTSKKKSK